MGITKIPARDFTLEIDANYGTTGGESWTPIGGLNSLTPSPSTNRADTTDYDAQGVAEHMVMERGSSFSLAGFYLEDAETGERDPGQAAVEAVGRRVGLDSFGRFRLTSPGQNVDTFLGSVEVTSGGGGHNDPAAWSATITVSGAVSHS